MTFYQGHPRKVSEEDLRVGAAGLKFGAQGGTFSAFRHRWGNAASAESSGHKTGRRNWNVPSKYHKEDGMTNQKPLEELMSADRGWRG